jgi:uncharacterized protein YbbC (DUF1343 family)
MDNHYIFVLLLVPLCLICGCSSPPIDGGNSGSIHGLNNSSFEYRDSFENAMEDLAYYAEKGFISIDGMTLYQINGAGVDIHGNATSWILGIRQNEEAGQLIYGENGWRSAAWVGPLAEAEIDLNTTISPTTLFKNQQSAIGEMMDELNVSVTDVVAAENQYTIIFTSEGTISKLQFDSTTGDMI